MDAPGEPKPVYVVLPDGLSPPPWLRPPGCRLWLRFVPTFVGLGILRPVDVRIVQAYCSQFASLVDMRVSIEHLRCKPPTNAADDLPKPFREMQRLLHGSLRALEAELGPGAGWRAWLFDLRQTQLREELLRLL